MEIHLINRLSIIATIFFLFNDTLIMSLRRKNIFFHDHKQ